MKWFGRGGSKNDSAVTKKSKDYLLKLGDGVDLEMLWVEGGTFNMGGGAEEWAKPVHEVELDGFWLSKTPVTQEQWKALMGNNPSRFLGEKRPVECVSWTSARDYCTRLFSRVDSTNQYTLPTEAEWEYACRAGSKSMWCFGDSHGELTAHAWYEENSGGNTHPVASKKPNAWGFCDMHGNVNEWCLDRNDPAGAYYAKSPRRNPQGPEDGWGRIVRGGSWESAWVRTTSAHRGQEDESYAYNGDIGFRVCRRTG